jgi:SPOR domain
MKKLVLIISPILLHFSCTSKKLQQSKTSSATYIPPTPPKRTATYRSPKPKIDTTNIAAFTTVQMPGWRIQLKPTDNKNKMLSTRTTLISSFSQHKIYTVYHSPFYKMRVGNFKLKADAARLKAKLQAKFPGEALYLVQDTIEYRMPRAEMIALKMKQVN